MLIFAILIETVSFIIQSYICYMTDDRSTFYCVASDKKSRSVNHKCKQTNASSYNWTNDLDAASFYSFIHHETYKNICSYLSFIFFLTWIVCIYHSKEIVLNKLVVKSVINSLVGDSFDIIFSWQLRTIHVQGNGWKNMFFYVLDSIYHKSVFPCVPFGFKVQRRKR